MKVKAQSIILYILPVVVLISACTWENSISGIRVTRVPIPSGTPVPTTVAVNEEPLSPTVVAAGSFADFQLLAVEIATALQDKNILFIDQHAIPSTWNCLGDEIVGLCKDIPADTTLEGIPVTYEWTTYKVYGKQNYKEMWQTIFTQPNALKLVAVAHQFGDNPLMPMAEQSFFAIVSIADQNDPASVQEVRVLFFEHKENTWHLAGEFVTREQTTAWLNNTCPSCYDMWTAWAQ